MVSALCPGATVSEFFEHADMMNSKMIKSIKMPSSKEVAKYGLDNLFKKKSVAVHGVFNRFLIFTTRFAPRHFITKMTAKMLKG